MIQPEKQWTPLILTAKWILISFLVFVVIVWLFVVGQPSRQPSSRPTREPTRQPSRSVQQDMTYVVASTHFVYLFSSFFFFRSWRNLDHAFFLMFSMNLFMCSQPSRQPSSQPTRQPSQQPTCQPSRQPVMRPTGQPSKQVRASSSNCWRLLTTNNYWWFLSCLVYLFPSDELICEWVIYAWILHVDIPVSLLGRLWICKETVIIVILFFLFVLVLIFMQLTDHLLLFLLF